MGTVAAVVTAVVAVASAAYSVYSSERAAAAQKKAMQDQADKEAEYGRQQADLIRANAIRVQKEQEAQYAGSGVQLGYGVSLQVPQETHDLAEKDALNALKDGYSKQQYYMNKGAMDSGNTRAQGYGSALSMIGSGVRNFYEMTKSNGVPASVNSGGSMSTGYPQNDSPVNIDAISGMSNSAGSVNMFGQ